MQPSGIKSIFIIVLPYHYHHPSPKCFSSCKAEMMCPASSNPHPSLLPGPGIHSSFCPCESHCSRGLICMESYNVCCFVSGSFHLAWCSQSASTLWHVSEFPFFLRLNNIPLYGWTPLKKIYFLWSHCAPCGIFSNWVWNPGSPQWKLMTAGPSRKSLDGPHFVYPFSLWLTLRLLTPFGYYE